MRISILLILLVIGQLVFSQTFNQFDANGLKTGQWKKLYGNGKIRYTGQFKNDKPVGIFKYYDENGFLESEITHSTNGHSSSVKMFFNNGKTRATGFYYDQLKDGIWIYYSEITGKPKLQESYKKGKKHGIWKIYFDNGNAFSEITYQDDLENGPWNEYFENGKKQLEANYKDGKFNGKYTLYNADGKPVTTGNYINGVRHGEWIYCDTNGVIERKEFIRQGWVYKEEFYKNGVLFQTKRQASKIKEN